VLNDEIRGVRGSWQRQIETFRRLRGIPEIGVALSMTISPFNLHQFPRAFAAAKEAIPSLTYQDFHLNIMHISPRYGNEDQSLSESDLEGMRTDVENFRKLQGIPIEPGALLEWGYQRLAGQYLATRRTPIRCHALRASCFIGPDGTVYPCSTWDRPLGNLREHDYNLERIWNSDEARRVQREIWEGQCPHCWTPCEAYQSLLGNLFRRIPPWARVPSEYQS
jgi:radical SAM protein with 4Fe4S-binding SPASM domain